MSDEEPAPSKSTSAWPAIIVICVLAIAVAF